MVGALRELIELLLTEIAISGTDGKSLRHLFFLPSLDSLRFAIGTFPLRKAASCLPACVPAVCIFIAVPFNLNFVLCKKALPLVARD